MTRPDRPSRPNIGIGVVIAVLLLAPFVALLWVSSYAKAGPELFGFPFFYWYSLLWVLISAVLTAIAYGLIRGQDRRRANEAARHARQVVSDEQAGPDGEDRA